MADFVPALVNWTVFYGDSDPATTEVTNVTDVQPVAIEAPVAEFLTFGGTVTGAAAGKKNPREVTFTVMYATAQTVTLVGLIGTTKYWLFNPSDSTTNYKFQGFLTKVSPSANSNNQFGSVDCTVRLTTDVTMS